MGRRQKVQKKLLRLRVEPRQRLVANVTEHIVVDDEIVYQTFEKRIVESEQRFRQIAHRALCYDGCVEVPEYGEECIRVVAVAVPNVIERVAGRALLADVVGSELAIGLAMFDQAPKKCGSSRSGTSLPHTPGRISMSWGRRAYSADVTMPSASGFRKKTKNCACIELTAMLPLQTGPLMKVLTSYSALSSRN